jgi:hypothetical protein
MLSALSVNLMKPGVLRRGIAIFFLIFTFMDIVFIDMLQQGGCSEEATVLPSPSKSPVVSEMFQENETTGLIPLQNTAQNQPAHPADDEPDGKIDEDCFCCCSHLIPGIRLDISVLNGSPQPGDPAILVIPTSPLRGTFHPPRFS